MLRLHLGCDSKKNLPTILKLPCGELFSSSSVARRAPSLFNTQINKNANQSFIPKNEITFSTLLRLGTAQFSNNCPGIRFLTEKQDGKQVKAEIESEITVSNLLNIDSLCFLPRASAQLQGSHARWSFCPGRDCNAPARMQTCYHELTHSWKKEIRGRNRREHFLCVSKLTPQDINRRWWLRNLCSLHLAARQADVSQTSSYKHSSDISMSVYADVM